MVVKTGDVQQISFIMIMSAGHSSDASIYSQKE